jgi:hypothetical protein
MGDMWDLSCAPPASADTVPIQWTISSPNGIGSSGGEMAVVQQLQWLKGPPGSLQYARHMSQCSQSSTAQCIVGTAWGTGEVISHGQVVGNAGSVRNTVMGG